ncbi:apoptotic chromatin condensation inducer in the nucleus isoform X1 [Sitophilus oryzae]|uniref:Apoptotic chromatin condensation inducer in the nucleus isoform X1 n=2 Tax=Sitophilus oryzae TaxID=7048 RepID=A0A6J2YNA8_SITOR|nr:apoptotic chromatin condensation inducer in the nucleus isoform X1 [Sitophilus oryzae]
MVRKSTRSTLRGAEKTKSETSKRTRTRTSTRRRKSSTSEDSDEELKNIANKSPDRSEKDSSESDSPDRDSKKPFKKRIRGRNRESPVPKIDDQTEDVKEGKRGKGKSKSKTKSNNYTANVESENDNIQVTKESPGSTKEEQQIDESERNISDAVSTGENNEEGTKGEQETVMSDNTESHEVVEVKEGEDNVSTEKDNIDETPVNLNMDTTNYSKSTEEVNTGKSLNEYNLHETSSNLEEPHNEEKEITITESTEEKKVTASESIEEKNVISSEGTEEKNIVSTDTNEDTTEQSVELPPFSTNDNSSSKKDVKKKICLKRNIDIKTTVPEDLNINEGHTPEVSPRNDNEKFVWGSSYESNNEKTRKKSPKKDETTGIRNTRKRISLKRLTTDERSTKIIESKNGGTELERSSSLQEHNEKTKEQEEASSAKCEVKRRHSSAFEKSPRKNEEKSPRMKKPTKVVKLRRKLICGDEEATQKDIEHRKTKWTKSDIFSSINILKLDTLRELCPNLDLIPDNEVNLELVKEQRVSEKERQKSFNEMEAEEMEKIEAELNAEPEDLREKENIIAMNRKISIVDDTASKLKPPPSPARNPVSDVLYITNLVRPFTVKQLKELLERTGKIREDGFWTDRIKSKCYVHYETTEEAEATRNALHGVNWPIGNGKKLIIEYSTVDVFETAKKPPIVLRKEKTPEKEIKLEKPKEEVKEERNGDRGATREWDIGRKNDYPSRTSRSRSRERTRKHSRRSYTPEDYHSKKKRREEPVPQKAMDDLFLKTKATPSIYWQPLAPEEIALKQQQRQARLEENKRRMEEIRFPGRRDQGRERDRGRDRNFRRR